MLYSTVLVEYIQNVARSLYTISRFAYKKHSVYLLSTCSDRLHGRTCLNTRRCPPQMLTNNVYRLATRSNVVLCRGNTILSFYAANSILSFLQICWSHTDLGCWGGPDVSRPWWPIRFSTTVSWYRSQMLGRTCCLEMNLNNKRNRLTLRYRIQYLCTRQRRELPSLSRSQATNTMYIVQMLETCLYWQNILLSNTEGTSDIPLVTRDSESSTRKPTYTLGRVYVSSPSVGLHTN